MTDARFAMHPVKLTFADPAAERAWRADYGAEHRGTIRRSVALLVFVFSAFLLNDLTVFREHLVPLVVLRFGVVIPALVVAWVVAGGERGRRLFARWAQEYVLVLAIIACGGMLAMSAVLVQDATPQRTWFAALGFELTLVGVYGYSRLRFVYAVLVGVITSIAAVLLLSHAPAGGAPVWVLAPFGLAMNVAGGWMTRTLEVLGRRDFAERQLLAEARARSEALLRNVLPAAIADRLRGAGPRAAIAERYDDVTVVLADVVGFTPLCERLDADELAALLDGLYGRFDALCEAHGVEKIKTLGDAWLAAGGVPIPTQDHAAATARLALAMRDVSIGTGGGEAGPTLRMGLHVGPAVAGVIGRTRFAYDLWGDAVTGATAMERASRPGGIRVSPEAAERLRDRFVIDEEDGALWLVAARA